VLTVLGTVMVGAPAFAVTPTGVPDPSVFLTNTADQLSNGLLTSTIAVLPYIIPLLIAFTIFARIKKWVGARKS
jgi:hypothetical protein